jgi:putative aldouronate transport system substrate-binding protein
MGWFFPAFGELLSTGLSVQDGKVVFGASTEQYKRTLEYLNQVWNSGAMNTTVYEEDGTQSRALIAQNKVACAVYFNTLTPANFASGKIDVTTCLPFTSPYYSERHAIDTRTDASWSNFMVSAKCSDIETACQWLDSFYSTEENPLNEEGTIWGISFTLGEYGKHWTRNEEKKTFTLHEVDGITTGNATNMVNLAPCWYDFEYVVEGESTGTEVIAQQIMTNVLPYREKYSDYDLGALDLTEDEADIYADYWKGIDSYIKEMQAKFITGQEDINAKWSEYVGQLNALGLQKVINMYQGAYNRAVKK